MSMPDGKGINFIAPEGTPDTVALAQRQLIAAQLAEVNSTVTGYGAARASSMADAQAAIATKASSMPPCRSSTMRSKP
jgi:hemolysin D